MQIDIFIISSFMYFRTNIIAWSKSSTSSPLTRPVAAQVSLPFQSAALAKGLSQVQQPKGGFRRWQARPPLRALTQKNVKRLNKMRGHPAQVVRVANLGHP